jgi:hypothetical protein
MMTVHTKHCPKAPLKYGSLCKKVSLTFASSTVTFAFFIVSLESARGGGVACCHNSLPFLIFARIGTKYEAIQLRMSETAGASFRSFRPTWPILLPQGQNAAFDGV